VLGYLGFGEPDPDHHHHHAGNVPFAWVDMPTVGVGRVFELWASQAPVRTELPGRIRVARNDQVLFGCLQIDEGTPADYDTLIYSNYCLIFDCIDDLGYPNLIRAWHYVPDIHLDERGLERYKRFSLGRHEAFVAKGRAISGNAPAASAVGKRPGNTVICFLAARRPGTAIENPRQVSAYSYPAQYGPRGPTFSRALFANWNDTPQLYISGTASILGHLSQHAGDAHAQTGETIVNLRAVMAEAHKHGLIDATASTDRLFKVYLRRPEFRPVVEARLRKAFGPEPSIVYLQADICRQELLLEIEVVCSMRQPD
jgi:chorismate lyase/3-hydroxybenzoate synthase